MEEQLCWTVSLIEECIQRNENRIFRAALGIMGQVADAEDIVQEAFLKLYQKASVFESKEHETAWLLRVTINLCKSRLRSPWRKKTVPLLESYPAEDARQQELVEAIQALNEKYRIVIHLYYYEGYSTKEIAEITEQKEGTVREQLTRARRLLKTFLQDEEGEEGL